MSNQTNKQTKWTNKELNWPKTVQELHYFFQIVFLKSAIVLQITNEQTKKPTKQTNCQKYKQLYHITVIA